jgi:nucleoid-associated protein YgaU
MQRDVKIGLILGLVFVAAIIVFLSWRFKQTDKQEKKTVTPSGQTSYPTTFDTSPAVGTADTAPATSDAGTGGVDVKGTTKSKMAAKSHGKGVEITPPGGTEADSGPGMGTPPVGTVTPPKPESKTYEVKAGDSLWKIAQAEYGDGTLGKLIADANKEVLKGSDRLSAGMKLTIPPKPTKPGATATGGATDVAPPGTTAVAGETRTHEVKSGESLWKIAQEYYGNGALGTLIAEANKEALKGSDKLTVGMKLTIPPAPAKSGPAKTGGTTPKEGAATESSTTGNGDQEYVVKKNDTLSDIASKFYGDGKQWKRIADANNIKNVNELRVGQKLKIPAEKKAEPSPAPAPETAPAIPAGGAGT